MSLSFPSNARYMFSLVAIVNMNNVYLMALFNSLINPDDLNEYEYYDIRYNR